MFQPLYVFAIQIAAHGPIAAPIPVTEPDFTTQERISREEGIKHLAEQFCVGACGFLSDRRLGFTLDQTSCIEQSSLDLDQVFSVTRCETRGMDAQAVEICAGNMRLAYRRALQEEGTVQEAEELAMLDHVNDACSVDALCGPAPAAPSKI